MALFVAGLVVLVVFYVVIFGVGIWAAWKKRARGIEKDQHIDLMTVGRRDLGMIVGLFTMTATFVGGGYINGIAEILYTPGLGLMWNQPLLSGFITLWISGTFYAKKMRKYNYVTMLDPLQQKFGDRVGGLFCLPAVIGDTFWSAGILIALGGTISVIIGVDRTLSIVVSACIAVLYTLLGGIYSVAYTDIVQLSLMFVGLWLCVGFAFVHPAVSDITTTAFNGTNWIGSWNSELAVSWWDQLFLLFFGGIPWQVYFQRVLATESIRKAQILSYAAAFTTVLMGLPSLLIGAIAASTDWNQTGYEGDPLNRSESLFILPIAIRYLTPDAVSIFGLAAVSAAVMSSIDSSLLSAASMFTRNVYKMTFRKHAGKKELAFMMRFSIFMFGGLALLFALISTSSYGIWYLSLDLVYVVLFPQLTCALYLDPNIYGLFPAYLIGVILRLGGGEVYLNMKPFIHYPGGANFPLRTFAMVVSFITLMVFSWIARYLFANGIIPERYDFLKSDLANGGKFLKVKEIPTSTYSEDKSIEMN